MAINPELITTIRVDQLPDETLSLTNLFPHTVGTELKSATIQELVDLVATSIGVSGGVGYLPISVTDGQQLPNVPESPGFFLCGAGTFLNINGFPNIICTENLNAIMSLTDHWELAVEIPINPLSGSVQSVTGSAVDNTDPLNPVINEIIYGVQNIIAGTNITVDDTDPANPIISATGGGITPDLQQVTEAGNETTQSIKVINGSQNSFTLQSNGINFEDIDNVGNTLLRFENTSLADQEVFIRGLGGTIALLSDIDDLATPTLQEVLDNNHDLVDDNNFQGTGAGDGNTGNQVNAFGYEAASPNSGSNVNALGSAAAGNNSGNAVNAFGVNAAVNNTAGNVNALGEEAGASNIYENVNLFGFQATADLDNQTVFSKRISETSKYLGRLSFNNITEDRKWELQDGDGTIAFLSDITGGGGSGGGASLSFYLNGSVSQGTIGGVAFREMDRTPILGAGTDFTINANGYIQSFITDAGVPNLLEIPAGNWNFETYFSASSGGGSPSFYIELYKWNGTTLSLIASNSATPRLITDGTNIEAYFSALAVPQTTLLATDRLAVRIYVTHSGRTITLHTENSHLCQVITTFTTGLTALNGLTNQVQYFDVGTGATNFNISSSGDTHTFNLLFNIRRNANNSSNNNINYNGYAVTGSAESSAVWTIKRLTITASGSITVATATNVAWTNRESATYI
jgi:hypothetical protein